MTSTLTVFMLVFCLFLLEKNLGITSNEQEKPNDALYCYRSFQKDWNLFFFLLRTLSVAYLFSHKYSSVFAFTYFNAAAILEA